MINRRKLIVALGAAAFRTPLTSFGQPAARSWRVGFLSARDRPDSLKADPFGGFLQGMLELGYIEGKNLEIEWRYAEGKPERLFGLAMELLKLKVLVIVTAGNIATSAAQRATSTLPIVMGSANDPVQSGFIKSLSKPGGNITGITDMNNDISQKYLELLQEMVPKLVRVAVLTSTANSSLVAAIKSLNAAAKRARIQVLTLEARNAQELDAAFSLMKRENVGGVIVLPSAFLIQHRDQTAALAISHRLPSISARTDDAEAGLLISYGANSVHKYRRAAIYVDKILKGAKPADLPVEQPTKFELIINGKTAKSLGLKIPEALLISADKVIE